MCSRICACRVSKSGMSLWLSGMFSSFCHARLAMSRRSKILLAARGRRNPVQIGRRAFFYSDLDDFRIGIAMLRANGGLDGSHSRLTGSCRAASIHPPFAPPLPSGKRWRWETSGRKRPTRSSTSRSAIKPALSLSAHVVITIEKGLGMLTRFYPIPEAREKFHRAPTRRVAAASHRRTAGSTSGEISRRTRA